MVELIDYKKLHRFCTDNRAELVEALDNHISETDSLCEAAEDDLHIVQNHKRNRLLKRLIKLLDKK